MMMFVYSNYSSSGVLWVAPHSVAEIVACFENRVSKSTLPVILGQSCPLSADWWGSAISTLYLIWLYSI